MKTDKARAKKIAEYMKLTKKDLAIMLYDSNFAFNNVMKNLKIIKHRKK